MGVPKIRVASTARRAPSAWRVAYSRLATRYTTKKAIRKGSVLANCSGWYFSTPHSVATPKVAKKPSRFNARQALTQAMAAMATPSNR